MKQAETKDYYDKFSVTYEERRHKGYHAILDDLEAGIVLPYAEGKKALEVGCGTGLILQRLKEKAASVTGMDLSFGMLKKSHDRGFGAAQASATHLPFKDNSFDVTYSFKVLAHVPDIRQALHEMARVTKPGGYVIAEFYNMNSIRYLRWHLRRRFGKRLKTGIFEGDIFTRYDRPREMESYFPESLRKTGEKGVMVYSVGAFIYKVPVLGKTFEFLETKCAGILNRWGGFQVMIYQKRNAG